MGLTKIVPLDAISTQIINILFICEYFITDLFQRKILLIIYQLCRSVHVPDTKFPQEKYAGNTKREDPHIERTLGMKT